MPTILAPTVMLHHTSVCYYYLVTIALSVITDRLICNECLLGMARYTDVTVRYVPRFGSQGSIRFRYNRKKKSTMLGFFSVILNRKYYK